MRHDFKPLCTVPRASVMIARYTSTMTGFACPAASDRYDPRSLMVSLPERLLRVDFVKRDGDEPLRAPRERFTDWQRKMRRLRRSAAYAFTPQGGWSILVD